MTRRSRFWAWYSRHQRRLQLSVKMIVPAQADADDLMQKGSMILWQGGTGDRGNEAGAGSTGRLQRH